MAFLNIAPTGTVLPFAGSTAPEGWLLCDGSAKSRSDYSKLFEVLSTTYGTGDGSTTFNIPDMRGVFPRGAGTNGTANYGGVTGHTPAGGAVANKGGQKTAKNGLSASAVASSVSGTIGGSDGTHTHSSNYGWDGTYVVPSGSSYSMRDIGNQNTKYSVNNTGSGHGHGKSLTAAAQTITVGAGDTETTPASLTLNYIIKA